MSHLLPRAALDTPLMRDQRRGKNRKPSTLAAEAERQVAEFNQTYPVGQRVRFWNGCREGEGLVGNTIAEAFVLGGHSAVVFIRPGARGCIALSHVEPITED